jgi:hypothetical protein
VSMKLGHYVGTAPAALLGAVYLPAPEGLSPVVEVPYRVGFFLLAEATSTINDWDISRYRDRWHPGAAFARMTARAMYRIRTERDVERWEAYARRYPDRDPDDLHRGPTHAIEWCLLVAAGLAYLAAVFPPTASVWWWVFLAVLLGTGGHVGIDALTPSGVPGSMVWNYFVHGEVWRRHAVSLRWHHVGWREWRGVPYLGRVAGTDDEPVTFRTPGLVTLLVRMWPLRVWREVPWVGMVDRTLQYPTLTVIAPDESREGCRPGLFYTDGCAEKLGFVPVMAFSTLVLGLVVTGTFRPVMWALTGWSVFAGGA